MAEQRSRSLTYDPITSKFTEAACMTSEIEVPEIKRSQTVSVFVTKDKAKQNFRTNERRNIRQYFHHRFFQFIITVLFHCQYQTIF